MDNQIVERASSFFARLKIYAAYAVRYTVFICRKYPLIALAFLLFYAFFLYRFLSPNFAISSNNKNLPIPQNTALPNSPTTSQPSSQSTTPAPAPVIDAAVATAVQSGENLSIRWDRPVQDPKIYADNGTTNFAELDSNCQSQTCNVVLYDPADKVEVRWVQEGKRFIKSFKISD